MKNLFNMFKSIINKIPNNVKLVVVSKQRKAEQVYNIMKQTNIYDFAENRVNDLIQKYEYLSKDINWHMIGHLQRNKVKYICPFVNLIQSVDSISLLEHINKYANINNRIIKVLIQVNISNESHKFGMSFKDLYILFNNYNFKGLNNVSIEGLMGIASHTKNHTIIYNQFFYLKSIYDFLNNKFNLNLNILSMGMSNDYNIAIQVGSNMIRLGRCLF